MVLQAKASFGFEYIVTISAFLAAFFADIEPVLWSIGFLIMTDTGLAIWAAWRAGYKETGSVYEGWKKEIDSRKAGRIITKIILYPLAIIVSKVAEEYLAPEIPWQKVTSGIVATVEIKSIFEKMNLLLGFDLWHKIKSALWRDKRDESKTIK